MVAQRPGQHEKFFREPMSGPTPQPQAGEQDTSMQYRRLGQTDLHISVMGFGASPLGGVFGPADAVEGIKAVHLSISEGINFFDVSPYYGRTLAEERLGKALQGRRDKVVLATKCGRYGPDEFDFSEKR